MEFFDILPVFVPTTEKCSQLKAILRALAKGLYIGEYNSYENQTL